MLRTCARRGVVGGTALAVGLAGLTLGQGAARADLPVPLSEAGQATTWGPGGGAELPRPTLTDRQASLPFTEVNANGAGSAIGLTAEGKVEQIGANPFIGLGFPSLEIPAALADETVVDIVGDGNYGSGMAVTDDGDLYTWQLGSEGWFTNMPPASELHDIKSAALAGNHAAAVVKQDGTVLAWGNAAGTGGDFGQFTPPPGLTGVEEVEFAGGGSVVVGLKSDGTLVAWGKNDVGQTNLPAVTTDTSDAVTVTDIATASGSIVALLSDGSLTAWGSNTTAGGASPGADPNEPPAELDGKQVATLASDGGSYFAIDSTGAVYTWGGFDGTGKPSTFTELPDDVDPLKIAQISINGTYAIAIQTKLMAAAKPVVTGTAKVDNVLAATAGTFSGEPDDVTGQWYRGSGDGAVAIEGADQAEYTLTTDDIGKVITYRSTATKGDQTVDSVSEPTVPVASNIVDSTTTVSAPATTYGRGVTVTVTVTNADSGNVTLSGAGAAQTKAVSAGKAIFTLPRTLGARSYALTATYAGSAAVATSTGHGTQPGAQAAGGQPPRGVTNKPSRKKAGKATISVATPAGLAKASGKVTVTLKLGKKTKRAAGTLRNGVVTVKLPKLPKKGKWSVTASYAGDANYLAGTSRTLKVRVR